MKIEQTRTYNGKPLDQYLIFPEIHRGGESYIKGLRHRDKDSWEVQVTFSYRENCIVMLEIDDTGLVVNADTLHLDEEGYTWTLEDLVELLEEDYDIPLGSWEVIQDEF